MYKLENVSSNILNIVWVSFRTGLAYYISENVENNLDNNKIYMTVLYNNYYFDIINKKVRFDVLYHKFKYVKYENISLYKYEIYENIFLYNKVKDNFIKEII